MNNIIKNIWVFTLVLLIGFVAIVMLYEVHSLVIFSVAAVSLFVASPALLDVAQANTNYASDGNHTVATKAVRLLAIFSWFATIPFFIILMLTTNDKLNSGALLFTLLAIHLVSPLMYNVSNIIKLKDNNYEYHT